MMSVFEEGGRSEGLVNRGTMTQTSTSRDRSSTRIIHLHHCDVLKYSKTKNKVWLHA